MATPLIMGDTQLQQLQQLRELASKHPVQVQGLLERLDTPAGKSAHMAQMDSQTIEIPMGFLVTFSIEAGHPIGACRHMSISSPRKGKLPTPLAVQWVCEALGFVGMIKDGSCMVYVEDLAHGHERAQAINVIQPVAVTRGGTS